MPKVMTIRIPDALDSRLEPLKGKINVSEVCRSALELQAQTHERIQATLCEEDTMKALVQRFRIQKAAASDWLHQRGLDDGERWSLADSNYQELQYCGRKSTKPVTGPQSLEVDDYGNREIFDVTEVPFPRHFPSACKYLEASEVAARQAGMPFEFDVYAASFLDAAREIWERVKDEI